MKTNLEEEQKLQLKVYGAALEMAHLMVWEFNIPERTVTAWSDTLNRNYKGFPGKVFTGVPESLFAYMPDAAERAKLQKTYETVCKGIPAGCEVWHLNGPDGELVCDRLYYSTIIKKDGQVLKAYGVTQDITDTKRAEQYYEQMINDFLVVNPTFLCAFHLNLTQDRCSVGHGASESNIKELQSDSASGLFKNIAARITDEEECRHFLQTYNCQKFSQNFILSDLSNKMMQYPQNGNFTSRKLDLNLIP